MVAIKQVVAQLPDMQLHVSGLHSFIVHNYDNTAAHGRAAVYWATVGYIFMIR